MKQLKRILALALLLTSLTAPVHALADRTVYYSNTSNGMPNIPTEALVGLQSGDYYISEISCEVE